MALLSSASVFAAPFARWFTAKTPFGDVRIWGQGDEYSADFETESGYAVKYDSSRKAYFYVTQDADGSLVMTDLAVGDAAAELQIMQLVEPHLRDTSETAWKDVAERIRREDECSGRSRRWEELRSTRQALRAAKKAGRLMAPPRGTTVGKVVGLTILVDFPIEGSSNTTWNAVHPDVTVDGLRQMLNGENDAPYGNYSSVRSYYRDVSNGCLDYTNVVIGPVLMPKPRSSYDMTGVSCGNCGYSLVCGALRCIKNMPNYTTDILPLLQTLTTTGAYLGGVEKEQTVRSLTVMFSGESAEVWNSGLWAHKSSLVSWSGTYPDEASFLKGGELCEFAGYQIVPITSSPAIYTFCHESGHLICDFPDLYNYHSGKSYNASRVAGYGCGNYCLMSYGGDPKNPVFIDPYLRAMAGWIDPVELPIYGGTVTVRANHTDVWKYVRADDPREYYLIENRQKTGHDASLPSAGILIWRCDERGDNTNPSRISGYTPSYYRLTNELTLEQAHGYYSIEQGNSFGTPYDAWYAENSYLYKGGSFSNGSQPCAHWRNGSYSNIRLSAFSENGETMTFYSGAYGAGVPVNDNHEDAVVLSAPEGCGRWSSLGASREGSEPTHCTASATRSIWWRVDVAKKSTVELTTIGSDIDTCLAVYTVYLSDGIGDRVCENDDWESGSGYSRVSFDADEARSYLIAVAGKDGTAGDICLGWKVSDSKLPDLSFSCTTGGDADLVVSSVRQTDENLESESEIDTCTPLYYSYRVVNSGLDAATGEVLVTSALYGRNSTGVWRSIGDEWVTTSAVFLAAGESCEKRDLPLAPDRWLQPGDYKIVCTIDKGRAIEEQLEKNNVAERVFSIVGPTRQEAVELDGSALGLSDCLLSPVGWSDAGWLGWRGNSFDGTDSLRSGLIGDNQSSAIALQVTGPGLLSFVWRVSSQDGADYLSCFVDEVEKGKISGTAGGWSRRTIYLGRDEHKVCWVYSKNASYSRGDDCGCLDQIKWIADEGTVVVETEDGKRVSIPNSWFTTGKIGSISCFTPSSFWSRYGLDFAVAAMMKTGKNDSLGRDMYVWQDFIAGTNPLSGKSFLRTLITMKDGKPIITWTPALNGEGKKTGIRTYKIYGSTDLQSWETYDGVSETSNEYFKVSVDL